MTPKERAEKALIWTAKEWRRTGTTTSRLALSEAVDNLNAIEDADTWVEGDPEPTTYLAAAKRYVLLNPKEVAARARLKAARTEIGSVGNEQFRVAECLRRAVDYKKQEQVFHVASNPDIVVVVQWFPEHSTTIRITELVSSKENDDAS